MRRNLCGPGPGAGWIWCAAGRVAVGLITVITPHDALLLRLRIPVEMQGRVYAARNTLQFFTIPLGYLLGGALVDRFFEP